MFSKIIAWLFSLLTPAKTVSTPSTSVTSDIGAVAGAVEAGENLAGKIIEVENTPEMVKGRENVALQKARDQIRKDAADALKTGNVDKINQDLQ